jgi:hypothetical protein
MIELVVFLEIFQLLLMISLTSSGIYLLWKKEKD